jgi:hypothetical protein
VPKKRKVTVKTHTRQVTVKTPAKVVDPITEQVNAAQLPQLQAIQAAQAASELAAKNAAKTTSGYYGALGELLKGVAPQVQDVYRQAAGDTSAFGKGFSDGLAHVQSQTQGEAADVAGISGGAAPPPVSPGGANALYALGGYIPATTMEREGAAFSSAAANLPGAAVGQGAASIGKILGDERTAQQGFRKNLTDLAAQVPGLRSQYQAAADALKLKTDTAATHAAEVKRQQDLTYLLATGFDKKGNMLPGTRAKLAAAMGYDPITGKPTASTTIKLASARATAANAAARLSLAERKQLSDLYGIDADGNLTLAGRKAALAEWKAQHPASKGGFTKSQLQKLSAAATTDAANFANGKHVTYASGQTNEAASVDAIPDYQVALKQLLAKGIPLTIAQRALNTYWPLGNANKGKVDKDGVDELYGRPYLTAQQRQVLQAAWPTHQIDPFAIPTTEEVALLREHGVNYQGPVDHNAAVPYPPPVK